MKVTLVLLAIVSLSLSVPQPRKIFHEHAEDFLDLIMEEAGHEIEHLFDHYMEFEEFRQSLDYMRTANFRNLIYEMEALPEFGAVIQFLQNDNIDVDYFLDRLNEMIEDIKDLDVRKVRHELSGRDLSAYINDCIALFPQEKLTALYNEKIAEDEEFREAMENLTSDEWDQLWNALWESETFIAEAETLGANGIDLKLLLVELKAMFGQF